LGRRLAHVYPIVFDRLTTPGKYAVAISSPSAASPPFAIGSPAHLYRRPLRNTLSFYENERDGPDFIRSRLRTAPDGLSVMANEHASLTGNRALSRLSAGWLGNVLGANAWGVSLVISDGTTFPDCSQHQVADIVGSLNGTGPVLAGGVVDGPSDAATTGFLDRVRRCPPAGGDAFARFNSTAVFRDHVQSYSTVEPAIDPTACSPLAFAWQMTSPRPLGSR
jgi:hypothetical protein